MARRFASIIGNQYVTGWWPSSQAKRVVCPCGRPKITLFVAGKAADYTFQSTSPLPRERTWKELHLPGKGGHAARFKERNVC